VVVTPQGDDADHLIQVKHQISIEETIDNQKTVTLKDTPEIRRTQR
jgi:hypothetical protein